MDTFPHTLLPLSTMARRLRVTAAWLRGEADAGRVPCLRADRRYLFSPEAVESVLAVRAGKPLPVTDAEAAS
jgi:hypothetical protein